MIKFSPKSKRDRLELLLKQSGKIEKTSVGKWYMKKLIFGFVLPLLLGLLFFSSGTTLLMSLVQAAGIAFFSSVYVKHNA